LTWFKLRIYLARLLDSFRICTTASEQERNLFIKAFPRHQKKITTIPNCIQAEEYQGLDVDPVANQLIYTGSFRFYANYEAMQWFVDKVFPKIIEQIPETRLIITGDHANLPFPSVPNITLTGYLNDVKPVIASSSISLAPLSSGGGTRLKILEAMALGIPVVATSKGAEGLGAVSGEHLLIADSNVDFAEKVVQLLKNPNLHDHISKNGKRLVKEKYDWEIVMPYFLLVVESAVG
jgi:glycosyltransferase involved in cell wall biosynthesis